MCVHVCACARRVVRVWVRFVRGSRWRVCGDGACGGGVCVSVVMRVQCGVRDACVV